MTVQPGVRTLTVHTEPQTGQIWFGTGDSRVCDWEGTKGPESFAAEDWVREAGAVRVFGTAANARLLLGLYNQRLKSGDPQSIQVGSPYHCADLADPAVVFRSMLENEAPASVGGWHEVTEADYRIYAVLAAYARDQKLSDSVKNLLRVHPSYPALSFLRDPDWESALQLLQKMVDPRFHVSCNNPNRISRLKAHFGLRGETGAVNVRAILTEQPERGSKRMDFAEAVVQTWYEDPDTVLENQSTFGPHDFLFRTLKNVCDSLEGSPDDIYVVGVLRASHVFLRFLKDVWLDNLTPARQYEMRRVVVSSKQQKTRRLRRLRPSTSYSPTLFVPEYFFKYQDEVEEWYRHARLN